MSLAAAVISLVAPAPHAARADAPGAGSTIRQQRPAYLGAHRRLRLNFVAPRDAAHAPERQPAVGKGDNRDVFFDDYYAADPQRS